MHLYPGVQFFMETNRHRLQHFVASILLLIVKTKFQPYCKKLFKTDLLNDGCWAEVAKYIYDSDAIAIENPYSNFPKILNQIKMQNRRLTRRCTHREAMFKLVQQARGGKPKANTEGEQLTVEDYAFTPEMTARWARLVLIKLGCSQIYFTIYF